MNLYILILSILLFFIISLTFSKNIFAPINIIMIAYLFSTLLIVPNVEAWNVDLHRRTIMIIIVGLLAFMIGYFVFCICSKDQGKRKVEYEYLRIPAFSKFLLLVFQIVTLILNYYYVSKIVGGITLSNFSTAMETYRAMSAYSDEITTVPGIVTQMSKISNIIFYLVAYVCINNYFYMKENDTKKRNITYFFLITFAIQFCLSILTAGRYNITCLIIGLVVLFTIIKAKNKEKISKVFKFSDYAKICIVFIIILVAFSGLRTVVGRTNKNDFVTYISSYFGGSVPLYDQYLTKYQDTTSEIFGFHTFHSVYRMLTKIGLADVTRASNYEFMSSGSLSGNVYTAFVVMYEDFGYVGVFLLQAVSGFIWGFLFKKTYLKSSNTKRGILYTIIYCIHISSIFLHFYGENFFSKVFSQAFILEIIYLNIVYFIIFKLKIKIRG